MTRAFCIPAVLFLLGALIINILTTISLPAIPALDIARTEGNRVSLLFFLRQVGSDFLACKVRCLVRILLSFCGQPCAGRSS